MSEKNRDLSKLSDLLAGHTRLPASKTAPKVTKLKVAANDNIPPVREVLAWPALERLAYRRDDRRLYALVNWKNLVFPGSAIESAAEEDWNPEGTIESRPSEPELLAAIGWTVVGQERWYWTRELVNVYESQPTTVSHSKNRNGGLDAVIGDLVFRDGKLIQWGRTKRLGVKASGAPTRAQRRCTAFKIRQRDLVLFAAQRFDFSARG